MSNSLSKTIMPGAIFQKCQFERKRLYEQIAEGAKAIAKTETPLTDAHRNGLIYAPITHLEIDPLTYPHNSPATTFGQVEGG